MGYELELPTSDHYAAFADLQFLERAHNDAERRLHEAMNRVRTLKGRVNDDDPVWLAAQIRVVEARRRCRLVTDALAELCLDAD
jgi:hypothetical protein